MVSKFIAFFIFRPFYLLLKEGWVYKNTRIENVFEYFIRLLGGRNMSLLMHESGDSVSFCEFILYLILENVKILSILLLFII